MTRLRLPPRFDVSTVTEPLGELKAGVATRSITVDGGDVHTVDAIALQVLCAAAVALHAHRATLTWEAVSPALRDAIAVLGLGAALDLPTGS